MIWPMMTLGDVTVNFDVRRRPVKSADRVAGEFPYYGASGVVDHVDDYLFDGRYLLVAEDGENLRSRSLPIAFLAEGKFWVNNHAHVLQGNALARTEYVCYVLSMVNFGQYITGSTQPKLTQRSLHSILIPVPPVREQVAIMDVLGALDDKISTNRAVVASACAMVQAICRTSATDEVELGEVARLMKASVKPASLASVAHFSLPVFDGNGLPEVVQGKSILSNKQLLSRPCVLLSKLNPRIPRVWDVPVLPEQPALASTEFLMLEPKSIPTGVLWGLLIQPEVQRELEGLARGTTGSHQRVKPEDAMRLSVPDPAALGDQAISLVDALSQRIWQAKLESRTLAALRDTLLPALMSGRLSVRDAEAAVSEVV
ncbi:Restriction endonuclease S subunit [Raineyella antarctica]|uniref:Restriction endonuclease S subunit n=1 Tax=Raineyella antarctica TaxID=1577474 RepID=A0A1G6GEF7_9ACTN|nr:restriction endonuclease subunit S [Raineyella antarctica]SDB80289.1 Restriction endonuclease S subunit [Raineyella antarctica]